jgi:drug/metabolite transporter (DMT)-like permease
LSNRTRGLIYGLLTILMFGAAIPATRIAILGGLDPVFVTMVRAFSAALLAGAVLLFRRRSLPRQHLKRLAITSIFVVFGFPLAFAFGMARVPATHGGVIFGVLPLISTIGGFFFLRERPSLAFWGLSILGAVIVTVFALRDGDVAIATGDLFLLLAVASNGVGYSLSALLARDIPALESISWMLVITAPITGLATLLLWPANAADIPVAAWSAMLYSGIFAQFIGYAFWSAAMVLGGVATIGQLQLLMPFVAIGLGALAGEPVDLETLVFAVVIMVVVALGRRAAVRTDPA